MGIYIFNTEYLLRHLERDDADETSQNDFGKNVIPAMLGEGGALFVYRFEGYWRDVGTLESLWQANMDLIGDRPAFDLYGGTRILSRNEAAPPQFVGEGGAVVDSILSQGCRIFGRVERSVLSPDVVVEAGAYVCDSVLMSGVRVGAGACVTRAVLDESVSVPAQAQLGTQKKLTVIGRESI